jgi:hypothetical protein
VAQPFDTSTRELIEAQPADWLECVGLGRREVAVINADLATITAVERLEALTEGLLDVESWDELLAG